MATCAYCGWDTVSPCSENKNMPIHAVLVCNEVEVNKFGFTPQEVCSLVKNDRMGAEPDESTNDESTNDESTDNVYKPAHYTQYAIEPIEFIMRNKLWFPVGNVIKYVMRYKAKNGLEDLKKARRYIDMIIEMEYPEEVKKDGRE